MTAKRKRKYERRTPTKIGELRAIIYAIAKMQAPVTLRTIFYVMADKGVIAKTKWDYHNVVVRLSGQLRKADHLPYEWIVDPTRRVDSPVTFTSVRAGLEYFRDYYRHGLEAAFDAHVQLWVESRSSGPELAPVTHELDVPLLCAAGDSSLTLLHDATLLITATDKPVYIYIMTDHDKKGEEIAEVIARGLKEMSGRKIHVKRIAITAAQIKRYHLPTKFDAKNNRKTVELESMPATVRREIARKAIAQHLDAGLLAALGVVRDNKRRRFGVLAKKERA